MRNNILLVPIFCAITSTACAAEQGIASYCQLSPDSALTAAHRTLPLGTQIKVINLDNGRSAILKIVDRGPFIRGRIIDVWLAGASALGFRQSGIAHVRIEKNIGGLDG
jgi:rare lipoprotein A